MGTSGSADGCVAVSINLNHPADEAWRALTEKERLEMWFGTPSDSLTAGGGPVRIDFGDGDFFLVERRDAGPERLVEFDWRFLGLGPASHLRWEVRPTAGGSQVAVRDHADDRDQETVRELTEGWQDFLGRLARYLDTGRSARYDCRSEIDGAIDLPPTADGLLWEPQLPAWLPVVTDEQRGRSFQIADSGVPQRFEITDWRNDGAALGFQVLIPGAAGLTSAAVRLRQMPHGIRLSFRHTGWHDLGLGTERVRQLRARFAAGWVTALGKAGQVSGLAVTGAR
jgi:uncharacterized protein YndB with AHSA1/START domain